MSYTYYDRLSWKTKILNKVRRLFTNEFMERILLKLTMDTKQGTCWNKVVPFEYLYQSPTIRRVEREGVNYELDISKAVDHYLYYGLIDASLEKLYSMVKKEDVVIDVGTNIGRVAFQLARRASNGRVICFEPDVENFRRFKNNLSLNDFKNIDAENCGLGDETGIFKLYNVRATNPGMKRILDKPDDNLPFHEIKVNRLDDVIAEKALTRVDIIKIDVEGFEHKVLNGAMKTIQRFKPILFIELDDNNLKAQQSSANNLVQYIKSIGYCIYYAENNMIVNKQENLSSCHFDILCRPC